MGDEVLTLATTGGRLWRAVRQPIAACLAGLHGGPHECRLGGGTTLAARWRHRDSFDIDLTVSRGASLSSLGADFERTMERLGGKVEYLVGRWKLDFGTGQVDLAQLEPCPARGQRTAVVDGEPFTVLYRHSRQRTGRTEARTCWVELRGRSAAAARIEGAGDHRPLGDPLGALATGGGSPGCDADRRYPRG